MIPYFHACGHLHYAKACQIYLQQMAKVMKETNADEYTNLKKTLQ